MVYLRLVSKIFQIQTGQDADKESGEYILGKDWRDLIPVIKVQALLGIYQNGGGGIYRRPNDINDGLISRMRILQNVPLPNKYPQMHKM